MSSTMLNLDNDYQFPPAPARAVLDRAAWNAAMADIAGRMRAVLAKGTALDDLVADLSYNAQVRVDETITPIVAAVQADIAALSQQVASTLAANQQIIDNFQAVTAVNLVELDEKIAEVEQRIAVILAGGLAAADVAVSPTRQFVTEDERAILINRDFTKRGTREQINAAAAANGLKVSELIHITDEGKQALALTTSTYVVVGPTEAPNIPVKASSGEVKIGTNDAKFVTPSALSSAMAFQTMTPATPDLGAYINGKITLTSNTTFGVPTGDSPGQSGAFRIQQDAIGGRTASWNVFWDFGDAGPPTLSTGANKVDWVFYLIDDGGNKAICSFKAAA